MNFIKKWVNDFLHWKKGCKNFRVEKRLLEVGEKKNKPPDRLLEIAKICNECDDIIAITYLNLREEKQFDSSSNLTEKGIKTFVRFLLFYAFFYLFSFREYLKLGFVALAPIVIKKGN